MKTMTSAEAKNKFGLFLDTTQREPVIITKNKRPVGIMLSMEDAKNTLVGEMFLEKEKGYDEWVDAKIQKTLTNLENGTEPLHEHEDVMKEVANLLKL